MGDRSNVNIVFQKQDGTFSGVNLYSHYEGIEFHLKALKPIIDNHVREYDYSYGAATMVAHLSRNHDEDGLGFGLMPIAAKNKYNAYSYTQDNEHVIMAVDFSAQQIIFTDERTGEETKFDFDRDGAVEACKYVLKKNMDTYTHFSKMSLDTPASDFGKELEEAFPYLLKAR